MQKEYRLSIFVGYDVEPEDTDAIIRKTLADAAHHLAGNGMLSNGLQGTVVTWSASIDQTFEAAPPKINPYYNPEKLGLGPFFIHEPGLGRAHNMLGFWADEDGRVYWASDRSEDSEPFEHLADTDQEKVLQGLDRVVNVQYAENVFDDWNFDSGLPGKRRVKPGCKHDLLEWVAKHLNRNKTK